MNVVAHGPFRVSSLLWQPRPGAWSLTVVCRAGFELSPGESPPVTLPKEAPDDERRLLDQAIDLAPRKAWPEVVLVGHAHAPAGAPATSLSARLAVGDVDKVIHVTGDRHLTAEGGMVGPAPFVRMPLRWERAAGGPDTWNPAGVVMGAGARADGWGRVLLPNLEPAGALIATSRDLVPPVGFTLIPPRWPTRVERLGPHASTWNPATWSERPLPEDFDFAYFDVAPLDQALPALLGTERIVLENLHPRHARLATVLRVVTPRATAGFQGVSQSVPLACDTLLVDTDAGVAQLVWRGQVALDHPQRAGIVIVEPDAAPAPAATATATMVLPAAPPKAPPFGVAPALLTTMAPVPAPARAPLPFAGPVAPSPHAVAATPSEREHAPRPSGPGTETLAPMSAPAKAALPFPGASGAAAPVTAIPIEPAWPSTTVPAAPRFGAPPLVRPPAAPPPEPVVAPPSEPPPLPPVVEPAPLPPPLIGPLARSEMIADPSTGPVGPAEGDPASDPYPIDRCARIAASLARRRAATAEILEANELDPAAWAALDQRWKAAIAAETARGKTELLGAYDAAFVAQLEEERGAITLEEYAGLQVASERGSVAGLLAEMTLPRGAMLRIERVWLRRIAGDAGLGAKARSALTAAREGT